MILEAEKTQDQHYGSRRPRNSLWCSSNPPLKRADGISYRLKGSWLDTQEEPEF
jgi:hypothetical protein